MTFHYGLFSASCTGAPARGVGRFGGLVIHLLAFIAVNAALFVQAGFQPGAGHFWGWGLGVAAHTLAVAGPGSRLERRLVQRERNRERG